LPPDPPVINNVEADFPMIPFTPGNELVPYGNGWMELDPDGVPMGYWEWCDEEEEWIFTEFPPPLASIEVSGMPQTGIRTATLILSVLLALSIAGSVICGVMLLKHSKKE